MSQQQPSGLVPALKILGLVLLAIVLSPLLSLIPVLGFIILIPIGIAALAVIAYRKLPVWFSATRNVAARARTATALYFAVPSETWILHAIAIRVRRGFEAIIALGLLVLALAIVIVIAYWALMIALYLLSGALLLVSKLALALHNLVDALFRLLSTVNL